jgi:translocation and assembly module TamA
MPVPPLLPLVRNHLHRCPSAVRYRGAVVALAAALLLTWATLGSHGGRSLAQDRTAETTLNVSGDEKLQKDLKELLAEEDKDNRATGPAVTLLQRAQAQKQEIEKALASRGFYAGTVSVSVAGRPVEDPAVLDAVEAVPAGGKLPVAITVQTGPAYKISDIVLAGPAGEAPARGTIDRGPWPLAPGSVADATAILKLDAAIVGQLQVQGYALAKIGKRVATVDHANQTMRLEYNVEAGPPAKMGSVSFSGSQSVRTEFLQRRVPFKPGEPFRPEKVDELRDSLTALGLFTSIRIKRGEQLDANGELPIEVEVQDRLPRTIGFGASYETSEGFAIGGFWLHRNLFGEGESLRLSAEINHIGDKSFTSIGDFGFSIIASFRKPDWWEPRTDAVALAQAVRERLDAYDREAFVLTGGFERRFSKRLRGKAGLAFELSRVTQNDETNTYKLLGVPLGLIWDGTNNLLEPTRGFRIALDVTPYVDVIENPTKPFVITRLTGSTYLDLSDSGRTVLAARASVGIIPGLSEGAIPPDKRFYAGGGGSVRGFAYQSVGPRDADRDPLGGTSLIEASLELRQRIGQNWGVVAFVDAGNVFDSVYPTFSTAPRVGAGVGVRYYTDFGPIRADVAVPLNRRPGDDRFGLYVSLGQAF